MYAPLYHLHYRTYLVILTVERETIQRETTSIKIKPDLWKEAKIEAIRHGKTVSELVEEALQEFMKSKKKQWIGRDGLTDE
jgi:hypothetical protein